RYLGQSVQNVKRTGLGEQRGKQFVEIACERAHDKSPDRGNGRKNGQLREAHMTHPEFLLTIFFTGFWMGPAPPTDDVGHSKKAVEEHVGVQLHLVKKHDEHIVVYEPERPDDNECPHGEDDENESGHRSKEFQVAHPVAPYFKEDGVDVEEFQK